MLILSSLPHALASPFRRFVFVALGVAGLALRWACRSEYRGAPKRLTHPHPVDNQLLA